MGALNALFMAMENGLNPSSNLGGGIFLFLGFEGEEIIYKQ